MLINIIISLVYMNKKLPFLDKNNIRNRIYFIRGFHVMLDEDLAELYCVETKVLNQAVKRNIERFPQNFMFQLSKNELKNLRSQFVTSKGGRRYLPYVFTEQGVAMLSGVLKSDIAIKISIQIMNAFIAMRKFLSSNGQIFNRLVVLERKNIEYDSKFEQVFDAIQNINNMPEKGIFFNGQVFDAYKFVSDLIRSASKSIILIDNYIDESVLIFFSKRNKNVSVTIFTKDISKQLLLDITKYNSQYNPIEIKEFKNSHDRFMIIDNKIVYHFGASLKDLGKKWFAFSRFDKEAFKLIEKLEL